MIRIGHGYDVHRLTKGRKLILGGVEIENGGTGLLGHSDADVLLHAVCDSLLGACAMGDIGKHFPDNDDRFKGADSMLLLKEVVKLIKSKGFSVNNIDATVIAQSPKLAPYIDLMRKNIAGVIGIELSAVSVKATTEERLGFTGALEGIAAHCVCITEQKDKIKFI